MRPRCAPKPQHHNIDVHRNCIQYYRFKMICWLICRSEVEITVRSKTSFHQSHPMSILVTVKSISIRWELKWYLLLHYLHWLSNHWFVVIEHAHLLQCIRWQFCCRDSLLKKNMNFQDIRINQLASCPTNKIKWLHWVIFMKLDRHIDQIHDSTALRSKWFGCYLDICNILQYFYYKINCCQFIGT
jgi:hypothetical protein